VLGHTAHTSTMAVLHAVLHLPTTFTAVSLQANLLSIDECAFEVSAHQTV
jgi:hypothetical protein